MYPLDLLASSSIQCMSLSNHSFASKRGERYHLPSPYLACRPRLPVFVKDSRWYPNGAIKLSMTSQANKYIEERIVDHVIAKGQRASRLGVRNEQTCNVDGAFAGVRTEAREDELEVNSTRRATVLSGVLALGSISMPANADSDRTSSERPRVFFDFSVDRVPMGRVVIEVDPKIAPIGSQRFLDLTKGIDGVGYRRTQVSMILDSCIVDNGPRALSFKASGRSPITGGASAELLEDEMDAKDRGTHDGPGVVSLIVRQASEREFKEKLVAVKGQLVTVSQALGELPNGAGFSITTRADSSLNATNLVIGRVVEGQGVVDALAALPRVKDNSASPFFKAGKASGDGRARVAGM